MSGSYPEPVEHDYERPKDPEKDHLPGEHIRHNSYHWTDEQGQKHRESYNYDENGYIENLHHDNEPGPWNH